MKRTILVVFVVIFACMYGKASFAARKTVTNKPVLTAAERAQISEKAAEILSLQPWTIYVTSQGAKKPAVEVDTLTFAGRGVSSANLMSRGYGSSNYSLIVQEDKSVVWETVQRGTDKSIASWRGELRGKVMSGTFSIMNAKQGNGLYSFTTEAPAGVSAPAAKSTTVITLPEETKPKATGEDEIK